MNARETIDNFLHVYGQYSYHDEAVIRGTRTALLHLREAIDAALEKGKGSTELFATDGEGYELLVICASTIATVGQPEYRINDEHEAEERRRERAAKLSAPCPSWDSNVVILPKSEVEAIRDKALEEAAAMCEEPRRFHDGSEIVMPSGKAYASAIRALKSGGGQPR